MPIPDIYLPSKYPSRVKVRDHKIVMILDTSGSMGRDDITQAMETVLSLKSFKPDLQFSVLEYDYVLQREYEIKKKKDIADNFKDVSGGGGTTFAPAIKYAVDNYKPDAIIYCTDGYGDAGAKEVVKGINFIWMLTTNGTSPCDWGIQIPMEINDKSH
jgi:predicted metal-dependent peptidase